jgi:hypothetical protein
MRMFRQIQPGHALILTMLLTSPSVWAALTITTGSQLPQGTVGSAYTTTLVATGGTGPYTWTLPGPSAPPAGLSLSAAGVLSGTPTTEGSSGFLVQVTDSAIPLAASATAVFNITVVPTPTVLTITTPTTLPAATVGTAYSQTMAATGGLPPYTWSLTSGTLPPGLSISSLGKISGTPTVQGTSTFSIRVKDSGIGVAALGFAMTVNAAGPTRAGVLSQVASGGGWKTSIYLINTSESPVSAVVNFWSNSGTPLTLPLTVTQAGSTQVSSASSISETVAPNATVLIESDSQASVESSGWAEVVSAHPITGYGVFHYTSSAGVESEGTVPLEAEFNPSFILPYDGVGGFSSGVALTNLVAGQATVVTARVWSARGTQLAAKNITLPAGGHTAFTLADTFPSTITNRGIIEFSTGSTANITGLGLRVNPTGGFTSVPSLQRP